MAATNQNNRLIVYLGIGLALLLGIFAADYFMSEVDVFKSKTALYQSADKRSEDNGDDRVHEVINAPPQPQPIANRPGKGPGEAGRDTIQHNYRLLPEKNKYSRKSADAFYYSSVTHEKTGFVQAKYSAQLKLAQNQGKRKKGTKSADKGSHNNNGNGDKPAYFDAPTVQPSKKSAKQETEGLSKDTQSDLVVVRNKETERKLENKLQAGRRALRMERYEAALSFFDDLYKTYRDEPRVLMGRAIALQKLGRSQAAKKAYKVLLDNDPDNVDAKINMYGIIQKNKPGLALRQLKALYEDHPENAKLAAQIGLISASVHEYNQALKYLQIAASITPNNPKHFYNLGIVEEHKGNPEKAIKYYEKAVDKIAVSDNAIGLAKEKIYDRLAILRNS